MGIHIMSSKLQSVMSSFFTLTGISVTVFDSNHNILAYCPTYNSDFCEIMQSNEGTRQKCYESDQQSFMRCMQSGDFILHKCHAGLVEATFPLKQSGRIIGYVMLGQITDKNDISSLWENIEKICEENNLEKDYVAEKLSSVLYKNDEEIKAAVVLLNACISYILSEEIIYCQNGAIISEVINYIDNHLGEDISISDLCRITNTSRTKLYQIFKSDTNEGISSYIRRKRLEKAKQLLKKTNMSVTDISSSVGFYDYNYFIRSYKKHFGKSPYVYR